MKTVFFESLRYKLITKNDFYYGSSPDIHTQTVNTKVERERGNLSRVLISSPKSRLSMADDERKNNILNVQRHTKIWRSGAKV